jgi:hypothetical protein
MVIQRNLEQSFSADQSLQLTLSAMSGRSRDDPEFLISGRSTFPNTCWRSVPPDPLFYAPAL